ncbi:MAG: hypothetical protein COX39_00875 [Candidatus Nealsonbacteria bacterium CG23_combo_of_CG06-09_8_20_14_all_40_13]|uniref:DNA-binding protein n=1 Tax=Candidatus Nealsonbacteria bacterium CG23_combo_of_CG06-09_8_20_14_all_40_13 TaxID=1974724 RepID=A0A2G9YRH0_9BACT|nr:MAG: hypothetical protein COX39_00875 [Candidatus Nealsonbacteria bacterium CG23_combo_of_CG06-09_8_20_14_all_40_13]PIR71223.1 MAG: hypothetical protein COU44_00765 [Candidatus Nealsonbacteria bacterium CG10_big_fil_rev_8_21_14_0_10_40_24]PIU43171.1 MAG: hypothetical protein COS97_02530 [Candidatus Nealsonbacteria bacterium CG07_land_8_20_14_0_80_40_10]
MNKSQLVQELSIKTGCSPKEAAATVNAFFSTLTETLAKGEKLVIPNFGSFTVSVRRARSIFHPQTKQKIAVPEKAVVQFRPAKNLKFKVRQS